MLTFLLLLWMHMVPTAWGQDIRIVYTGHSLGIGSGQYAFSLPEKLVEALPESAPKPESVVAFHGLLAQGPYSLAAKDGRVQTLVEFLAGEIECGAPQEAFLLETAQERFVLAGSERPEWANALELTGATQDVATVRDCTGAGHTAVLMTKGHLVATEPIWDINAFEFRLGLRVTMAEGPIRSHGYIIGVPKNEGARRFTLLKSLTQEVEGTLFVDTGSFVDGNSSVRDDALSLHRPIGFQMLKRLNPAALVPGQTELAGGATQFLAEARAAGLPYLATNWTTNREDLQLPTVLEHTVESEQGLLTVAFLGVIDPSVQREVHHLVDEGVTITDPVEAVTEAVAALHARPAPPNAIVLLSSGSPELIQNLRRSVVGVDLVIGDRGQPIQRLQQAEWTLMDAAGDSTLSAAVPPLRDIMTAELGFAGEAGARYLQTVRVNPNPIPETTLPDSAVRQRVTEIRATEYPVLDHPLVPADPASPYQPISEETWGRVVCEAVREETEADVVLLSALPEADPIPGPLTELLTVDRLALRDHLEVHWIPGDRMNWLLLKLAGVVPISCGAPLGKKTSKTQGRGIEGQRIYRIVTTDRARQTTAVGGLLKGAYSPFLLDKPGYRILHDERQQPLTLRAAVLSSLRALRERMPPTENYLPVLLKRSPNDKPPLWLGRIRRLSLKAERFQGAENDAYSSIPETKATAPSSLTIGTDIDAAIDYSSATLLSDVRVRAAFARLQVKDEDPQESADDLRISSSLSLPGMRIPLGKKIKFMPYTEVLLDSEFTPAEEEDVRLPRQSELSIALGLSAGRWGPLRRLRLGLLSLRDLAQEDKPLEWGARFEAETFVTFGPRLSWSTLFDTNVFGDTLEDDASDLRFKTQIDSRVSMPLARWLSVSVYGQAFLFRGRIDETRDLGASFTGGLALDIAGAFEL